MKLQQIQTTEIFLEIPPTACNTQAPAGEIRGTMLKMNPGGATNA